MLNIVLVLALQANVDFQEPSAMLTRSSAHNKRLEVKLSRLENAAEKNDLKALLALTANSVSFEEVLSIAQPDASAANSRNYPMTEILIPNALYPDSDFETRVNVDVKPRRTLSTAEKRLMLNALALVHRSMSSANEAFFLKKMNRGYDFSGTPGSNLLWTFSWEEKNGEWQITRVRVRVHH